MTLRAKIEYYVDIQDRENCLCCEGQLVDRPCVGSNLRVPAAEAAVVARGFGVRACDDGLAGPSRPKGKGLL